jgi:hypothetical protein
VFLGDQGVVGALAVHAADGVDGRQVDDVEAHVRDAVQRGRGGGEGAVHRAARLVDAAGGAREELVPGAEGGALAVHPDLERLALGDQLPHRMLVHDPAHLRRKRGGDPVRQRAFDVTQSLGRSRQLDAFSAPVRPSRNPVEQQRPRLEIVRQFVGTLSGSHFHFDGVQPGGPRIAPGVDPVGPQPFGVRDDLRGEVIETGALLDHPGLPGHPVVRSAPGDCRGDRIVSFTPNRGGNRNVFACHGFRRIAATRHRR